MNYFTNRFALPCPFLIVRTLIWSILITTTLGSSKVHGQAMVKKISLLQRVQASRLIVEGRIVAQESYWKHDSTGINTSHKIEVFKVWKGSTRLSFVQLITPGGKVGTQMEVVEPSLKPHIGEVGLFFLEESTSPVQTPFSNELPKAYLPYSSLQGHIAYDELKGKANDLFTTYSQIETELYGAIRSALGSDYQNIRSYKISPPRLQKRASARIERLQPAQISAGTSSELQLYGLEFGEQGTESAVFFPNADNGGATYLRTPESHIVSWTDTLIVINVPPGAGSGTVRVKRDDGQLIESETSLNISYSHMNVSTGGNVFRPFLADKNGEGGYTLQYSNNDANNGVAFTEVGKKAFDRALTSWQCATGVQFTLGEPSSSTALNPSNPPNLIMFTNDVNTLPAGVLGRTNSWFISCDGTTWLLDGFDIVFRKSGTGGINWHFEETDPCPGCFDFETVALHELGHAHLLGHVINSGHVMHYSIASGSVKRSPEPESALMGASSILEEKIGENLCFSFYPAMGPLRRGCEALPLAIRVNVLLEGYYDPGKGTMNNYLWQRNMLPMQQPFSQAPYQYPGNETLTNFPETTADWVLLALHDPEDRSLVAQKAALLTTNGTIIDTSGSEYLTFQDIPSGAYFLSIHHPGHLSVYSSQAIELGPEGTLYDFIDPTSPFIQPENLKNSEGYLVMYAGDYTGDGKIDREDFLHWRNQHASPKTYNPGDVNGDGQISVHDLNLWMRNRNIQLEEGLKR